MTTSRLTNANTILYISRPSLREDAEGMATRIMKNEPYTILTLEDQPDPTYDGPSALLNDVSEQLDSIQRTKSRPDDGPFRGRSSGHPDESDGTQRAMNEFESGFGEYMQGDDEVKDLSEFTD